jgi:AraC family transcriptional regulator of arabinose operon
LTHLHAGGQPSERSLSAPALRQYLVERISEPLDLEVMARHFSVSKSHLCRSARALLGQTLGSLAEQLKMDWARTLLEAESLQLSVAEVARRTGYEDPLYFSRVFKKQIGQAPTHWRRARS